MNSFKHKLHVVAFDVPYPPNYGGVIDVFYRLKALHEAGVGIILHCFEYGRGQHSELDAYCEEVHYYRRSFSFLHFFRYRPFIVSSRASKDLLTALVARDFPIFFEGVHTTAFLSNPALSNRLRMVRLHNIEGAYYRSLSKSDSNWLKRFYFRHEARFLKNYEVLLPANVRYFAISESDCQYFKHFYPHCETLTPFHGFELAPYSTKTANCVVFQGNFTVAENYRAALYLMREVFASSNLEVIFAGGGASRLQKAEKLSSEQFKFLDSPDDRTLWSLSQNAGVHVLFTHQASGFKLKLLHALFSGRPVIANPLMVQGTDLEQLCIMASTATDIRRAAEEACANGMSIMAYEERAEILKSRFSNARNATAIIDLLEPQPL